MCAVASHPNRVEVTGRVDLGTSCGPHCGRPFRQFAHCAAAHLEHSNATRARLPAASRPKERPCGRQASLGAGPTYVPLPTTV
jgi:hypothetical protein